MYYIHSYFSEIDTFYFHRYLAWLECHSADLELLGKQVQECCFSNLERRFTVLVKHLEKMGVGLKLDGSEQAMSCFIYAMACDSLKVCKLMIECADHELLMFEYQSDQNHAGITALHVAVANSMEEIIDGLFAKLDKNDIQILITTHITGKHFMKG